MEEDEGQRTPREQRRRGRTVLPPGGQSGVHGTGQARLGAPEHRAEEREKLTRRRSAGPWRAGNLLRREMDCVIPGDTS